ncbi:hypothetical protein V6N13_039237 [Hibiscus sabdariffa]|uniref:Uncharacterized protein n=1 Tax=Hibiscus sabdariffa TaxID=183260 RepID=A0ABR2SX12_9ROSI
MVIKLRESWMGTQPDEACPDAESVGPIESLSLPPSFGIGTFPILEAQRMQELGSSIATTEEGSCGACRPNWEFQTKWDGMVALGKWFYDFVKSATGETLLQPFSLSYFFILLTFHMDYRLSHADACPSRLTFPTSWPSDISEV